MQPHIFRHVLQKEHCYRDFLFTLLSDEVLSKKGSTLKAKKAKSGKGLIKENGRIASPEARPAHFTLKSSVS